jgi:drug/metabolite transporter (DMT)-like permease
VNFKIKGGEIMQLWQWWIGLIAVLIMAGGLWGIFYLAIKQNAVIGIKTIQFLAIVFVLPLLLVLGITNVLGRETIGTLLGVIVGFVLSWFGRE